jgi:hypothetical protein
VIFPSIISGQISLEKQGGWQDDHGGYMPIANITRPHLPEPAECGDLGSEMHWDKIVSSRRVNSLHDMSASFHRMIQRRRSKKFFKKGKNSLTSRICDAFWNPWLKCLEVRPAGAIDGRFISH